MFVEYSLNVKIVMSPQTVQNVANMIKGGCKEQKILQITDKPAIMDDHQDKPTSTLLQRIYAKSCDMLSDTAECIASWPIGQSILRQTDRCLWTFEKCAEWSVPNTAVPKQTDANGTFGKPGPLTRPLPWIFFLPMLILLRMIRLCVNLGAILLGMETVKPAGVIRFIQVRRRRVRALKFLGLRRIRYKKTLEEKKQEENSLTWRNRIYNLMSGAMCFRPQHNEVYEKVTVGNSTDDVQSTAKPADLKRKYNDLLKHNYLDWENVDDDEELINKISKLADNENENDPDFLPAEEDSASGEDSTSDAEDDEVIASHSSPKQMPQRSSSRGSLTNETIEEENEDADSTTLSANSDDESSQHIYTEKSAEEKPNQTSDKNTEPTSHASNVESVTTSDEYQSAKNSVSTSPEPAKDVEFHLNSSPKTNLESSQPINKKEASANLVNAEKNQVTVTVKSNESAMALPPSNHVSAFLANEVASNPRANSNSNSNSQSHGQSPRGHGGKKQKHKRRFSNLLRRKRK